ncbi:response regulator [Candidatus Micrarchaeota archaeon]|nr:response regulator [Candidatus Micrarchaeota archaeon]
MSEMKRPEIEKPHILVVEPDDFVYKTIAKVLEGQNIVRVPQKGAEDHMIRNHGRIQLVITDHGRNTDGARVIRAATEHYVPSIALSADDEKHLEQAKKWGAKCAMEKPFSAEKLAAAVKTYRRDIR